MSENLITVAELDTLMKSNHTFELLDVREDCERAEGTLPNDTHIPIGEITTRFEELDSTKEFVVYCKAGVRSFQVCRLLEMYGFANVKSLVGGIEAWVAYENNKRNKL